MILPARLRNWLHAASPRREVEMQRKLQTAEKAVEREKNKVRKSLEGLNEEAETMRELVKRMAARR